MRLPGVAFPGVAFPRTRQHAPPGWPATVRQKDQPAKAITERMEKMTNDTIDTNETTGTTQTISDVRARTLAGILEREAHALQANPDHVLDLEGADLDGADLANAGLNQANLTKANLRRIP